LILLAGALGAFAPGLAHSQTPADDALAPRPDAVAGPTLGEGVAIEVDGTLVSSFDVYQRMRWILFWSRLKPTREVLVRVEDEARRMLADEALQLAELRRISPGGAFIVSDLAIEDRIGLLAKQRGMTAPDLLARLVDEGIEAETLFAMFRAQMSWDGFVQSRYAGRIWIDPSRVANRRQQLEANAQRDRYRVREIVLPGKAAGGRSGGADFAEALWQQIVGGQISLGEVAEQFSTAASASKGGDIGWVGLEDLPAETRAIVAKMGPGQITPPIEADGQYIIYYVDDVAPAGGQTTLDLVAAFSPRGNSQGDQGDVQTRLSALQASPSCDGLKALANRAPGIVIEPIVGATAATIAPDFRDWALRSSEGDISPIVQTPTGMGFLRVCKRYRTPPKIPSDEEIKNELFLARLVTLSRSELNRLRQGALITQRY
jgi:peptidyl-prolyl cis-trans isomerase SurA